MFQLRSLHSLVCLGVVSFAALGCGGGDEYMPLKVNRTWTYRVSSGFEKHTVPIRVDRAMTVASSSGYELSGPLGVSRVGWSGKKLVAEYMVNAKFSPPIPLLVPMELDKNKPPKQVAVWHGHIDALGRVKPSSAILTEQVDSVELGTRKVSTILAVLEIKMPGGSVELKSWYQSGVGLVQQEQRTNGQRIVQMIMVGHTQ